MMILIRSLFDHTRQRNPLPYPRVDMKTIIALLALSIPSLAAASGPDNVYVYGTPNKNYQCTVYLAYFETQGNGVLYADRCTETNHDSTNWPQFPAQNVRLSMDFAPRKSAVPAQPRIFGDCQFVAHAQNQDRTTSSVVDCR